MTIHAAPPADLLQRPLAARLGAGHVLTADADMAGHLVESRGLYAGAAWAVARPKDTEEVSFVVSPAPGPVSRSCRRAATRVSSAAGCRIGGIVLSLARLDRSARSIPSTPP